MNPERLTRRKFLKGALFTSAAVILTTCHSETRTFLPPKDHPASINDWKDEISFLTDPVVSDFRVQGSMKNKSGDGYLEKLGEPVYFQLENSSKETAIVVVRPEKEGVINFETLDKDKRPLNGKGALNYSSRSKWVRVIIENMGKISVHYYTSRDGTLYEAVLPY